MRTCVICGESFVLEHEDSVSRNVCSKPECLKTYRFHCGKDDRYWQKNKKRGGQKK